MYVSEVDSAECVGGSVCVEESPASVSFGEEVTINDERLTIND